MKGDDGKVRMSGEDDLLEALAQLEHEQWVHWSKAVAHEVPVPTRERWQQFWVPYAVLSEDVKEADRIWARKVVELLIEEQNRGITKTQNTESAAGSLHATRFRCLK